MKTSFNLANVLTVSRIGLSALFVYLMFFDAFSFRCMALAVFLAGCATDYFDGKVARSLEEITPFGQLLDPIADKVLNFSAFVSFAVLSIVPAWIVICMLAREIGVTALRFFGLRKGLAVSAESLGKWKTILQDAAIIAVLLLLAAAKTPAWRAEWAKPAAGGVFVGMLVVLALTVASGVSYALRHLERGHAPAR